MDRGAGSDALFSLPFDDRCSADTFVYLGRTITSIPKPYLQCEERNDNKLVVSEMEQSNLAININGDHSVHYSLPHACAVGPSSAPSFCDSLSGGSRSRPDQSTGTTATPLTVMVVLQKHSWDCPQWHVEIRVSLPAQSERSACGPDRTGTRRCCGRGRCHRLLLLQMTMMMRASSLAACEDSHPSLGERASCC